MFLQSNYIYQLITFNKETNDGGRNCAGTDAFIDD